MPHNLLCIYLQTSYPLMKCPDYRGEVTIKCADHRGCPGQGVYIPGFQCNFFSCRAVGTLIGEGVSNFITDWDKVSATVSECSHRGQSQSSRVCLYSQFV